MRSARILYSRLKGCVRAAATQQDIEAVDPEYYKNLRWMLENPIADVLDLTFTEEVDYFGAVELVELKPGGAGVKVRALRCGLHAMRAVPPQPYKCR